MKDFIFKYERGLKEQNFSIHNWNVFKSIQGFNMKIFVPGIFRILVLVSRVCKIFFIQFLVSKIFILKV